MTSGWGVSASFNIHPPRTFLPNLTHVYPHCTMPCTQPRRQTGILEEDYEPPGIFKANWVHKASSCFVLPLLLSTLSRQSGHCPPCSMPTTSQLWWLPLWTSSGRTSSGTRSRQHAPNSFPSCGEPWGGGLRVCLFASSTTHNSLSCGTIQRFHVYLQHQAGGSAHAEDDSA